VENSSFTYRRHEFMSTPEVTLSVLRLFRPSDHAVTREEEERGELD
jgi:hypothetical protein